MLSHEHFPFHIFFYKKNTFFPEPQFSLLFPKLRLRFSSNFLNFCCNKLAKMGYPVFIESAFYYLQLRVAWFFHYFVIQCLIFIIHDCQRKFLIFGQELAKNELISISGM